MGGGFQFALGPRGSYFFGTPSRWYSFGLPKELSILFSHRQYITNVLDIALGPNDSWFVLYETANGKTLCSYQNLPEELLKWLMPVEGGPLARNVNSLQVVLGPNGSFFALDSGGSAWSNLSDEFNQTIAGRLNTFGGFTYGKGPHQVALGWNGTFVFTNTSGQITWSDEIMHYVPALSNALMTSEDAKNAPIVLSPDAPGVYIRVALGGICNAAIPPSMQRDFAAFAHEFYQDNNAIRSRQFPLPPSSGSLQTSGVSGGANVWSTMNHGFNAVNNIAGVMGGGASGMGGMSSFPSFFN